MDVKELKDPDEGRGTRPACPPRTANRTKPGKENWPTRSAFARSRLRPKGESAGDEKGPFGGWFCPCRWPAYDTSGSIRQGPASRNLDIPPYRVHRGHQNQDRLEPERFERAFPCHMNPPTSRRWQSRAGSRPGSRSSASLRISWVFPTPRNINYLGVWRDPVRLPRGDSLFGSHPCDALRAELGDCVRIASKSSTRDLELRLADALHADGRELR